MTHSDLKRWLLERNPDTLATLWQQADATRREHVGNAVHLRGLVELSNHCRRLCAYCGLRAANRDVPRYRMSPDEVLDAARQAVRLGFGTVVLQAGEDMQLDCQTVAAIIRNIKTETDLAITLSLGERTFDELAAWREVGADRYLLRFETSNARLFAQIHPSAPGQICDRIGQLKTLRDLGYEVGSGVMVGIPGQSTDDLARDILLFRELDLDMIGVGPFLPHPDTPLGQATTRSHSNDRDATTNDALTTFKVIALTRLVCPNANIPSTTALATLEGPGGYITALQRGANVVMPNVTPVIYRQQYKIYPDKACFYDNTEQTCADLRAQLSAIGRHVGTGRGDSPNRAGRPGAAGIQSSGKST